tara:strand:- start:1707 stop:1958 length:252 start_codon:yes stop_codon:yes gene_type:complete
MNFSKNPVNSTKVNTPLNIPNIKPKIIFSVLYDEMLPSNKNNIKLVNNRKIIRDIAKIMIIEKKIIIVGFIETYLEIKNDKST